MTNINKETKIYNIYMIPAVIHHIWLQGYQEMPNKLKLLREGCKAIYKDYKLRLWDENEIEELLKKFDMEVFHYYQQVPTFAQKSDIARYVIIYLYGGMYLDTDYKCNKSLTHLLSSEIDFFYVPFEDIAGLRIMNGIFGCKKNHPVLKITIDNMINRFKNGGGTVTHTTGTQLFYDSIMQYHNEYPDDNRYIIFSHLQLFPCNVWQNQQECNNKWKNVHFMTHLNEGSWNPMLFSLIKIFVHIKTLLFIIFIIFIFLKIKHNIYIR